MAQNVVFIFTGESNSGASAFNSDAAPGEVDLTTSVRIWDNVGMADFQDLLISGVGSNNVLGHADLESSINVGHSWERVLQALAEDGYFVDNPVYLVKCGQGGSIVSQWQSASAYWTTMQARVDAALAKIATLNANPIKIYICMSLGINDAKASSPITTTLFKTYYGNFLANMNTKYSPVKIWGTFIPQNNATYLAFNEKIMELGNELSYFDTIPISGAPLRVDTIHWAYAGVTVIGTRFFNYIKNLL